MIERFKGLFFNLARPEISYFQLSPSFLLLNFSPCVLDKERFSATNHFPSKQARKKPLGLST